MANEVPGISDRLLGPNECGFPPEQIDKLLTKHPELFKLINPVEILTALNAEVRDKKSIAAHALQQALFAAHCGRYDQIMPALHLARRAHIVTSEGLQLNEVGGNKSKRGLKLDPTTAGNLRSKLMPLLVRNYGNVIDSSQDAFNFTMQTLGGNGDAIEDLGANQVSTRNYRDIMIIFGVVIAVALGMRVNLGSIPLSMPFFDIPLGEIPTDTIAKIGLVGISAAAVGGIMITRSKGVRGIRKTYEEKYKAVAEPTSAAVEPFLPAIVGLGVRKDLRRNKTMTPDVRHDFLDQQRAAQSNMPSDETLITADRGHIAESLARIYTDESGRFYSLSTTLARIAVTEASITEKGIGVAIPTPTPEGFIAMVGTSGAQSMKAMKEICALQSPQKQGMMPIAAQIGVPMPLLRMNFVPNGRVNGDVRKSEQGRADAKLFGAKGENPGGLLYYQVASEVAKGMLRSRGLATPAVRIAALNRIAMSTANIPQTDAGGIIGLNAEGTALQYILMAANNDYLVHMYEDGSKIKIADGFDKHSSGLVAEMLSSINRTETQWLALQYVSGLKFIHTYALQLRDFYITTYKEDPNITEATAILNSAIKNIEAVQQSLAEGLSTQIINELVQNVQDPWNIPGTVEEVRDEVIIRNEMITLMIYWLTVECPEYCDTMVQEVKSIYNLAGKGGMGILPSLDVMYALHNADVMAAETIRANADAGTQSLHANLELHHAVSNALAAMGFDAFETIMLPFRHTGQIEIERLANVVSHTITMLEGEALLEFIEKVKLRMGTVQGSTSLTGEVWIQHSDKSLSRAAADKIIEILNYLSAYTKERMNTFESPESAREEINQLDAIRDLFVHKVLGADKTHAQDLGPIFSRQGGPPIDQSQLPVSVSPRPRTPTNGHTPAGI